MTAADMKRARELVDIVAAMKRGRITVRSARKNKPAQANHDEPTEKKGAK
jgi:hypothetical protein